MYDLIKLYKEERPFILMMINFFNIPDINGWRGRDVGNLMMADYVKNVKEKFLDENANI